MMWNWWPGGGWAMSIAGLVMMVVFWGGVVALVVAAVRMLGPGRAARHDAAMDTLARRLASGEITSEEYERIRKVLET